uniref:Retrovirus-related Pol polyprotein from transposon TNT 1-94 n=1 Tax=Tanacetum cinerariifolium TaxID=118510 RepID=A0A699HXP2_TANCI|nr:retrovirus-related Pol polyprotein from transposon TNT 1-94 [Tanacetum cinerariifolium]
MHMLLPKPDSFLPHRTKNGVRLSKSFYLKQAQQKQQSLYNGKVLLEKHDPPAVYDSEETLQLAQDSRLKIKQLNKEIKPANYTKINHLSGVFVSQTAKSREELYFSNTSKTANVSKPISIPNEEFSDDTTPSVAQKFLNEIKSTIVTLQRVVKQKMTLDIHNWSSSVHQEIHKIVNDEIFLIVNQVDARLRNFKIQFLKEAAKFVRDFKSLAKEADESLAKHKALELEIKHLLRAIVSYDIMSVVQNNSVEDTLNLQTELEHNTAKTRRPQPRSNTKNDRVPSASKSSCNKNKEVKVEEHPRNLPLSKNKKHMSSEYMNSRGKKLKENVSNTENQKKQKPQVMKPKKVGSNERLSSPKPSKPRSFLRWSPTGRLFDLKGKIITSSESKSQSESPSGTYNQMVSKFYFFSWHVIQICLWCVDSGCSKHMTRNLKLLINFVWKFLGTIRFGNDHVAAILVEAARTMLIFSRASLFLWGQAIATACYTQNHSIIHRRFNKTPYVLINSRKLDISFLHVFGALCYPKNDREDIRKLGAKGDIGFFIGYSADSCAYRVYN